MCYVVTASGLRSGEHDKTTPARPRERSRERDVGDRQRSVSGRNDHGGTSSQQRDSQPPDVAGERGRDSRAVPDKQPVKTASTVPTTDSRAKSSSASAAGGQLTTSSQPRSSTASTSTVSTAARSERPATDKASDKTPAKVCSCCCCICTVECMDSFRGDSHVDNDSTLCYNISGLVL